jgi:hypothetical protein
VPGIHVFGKIGTQNVDGRDKPGHDEEVGGVLERFFDALPLRYLSAVRQADACAEWPRAKGERISLRLTTSLAGEDGIILVGR